MFKKISRKKYLEKNILKKTFKELFSSLYIGLTFPNLLGYIGKWNERRKARGGHFAIILLHIIIV